MASRDLIVGLTAGAAAGVVASALFSYLRGRSAGVTAAPATAATASADISTTSSGHSGNVYETKKAVAEYLQFHFGKDSDILPYAEGPHSALNFATRTAELCVTWAQKQGLPLDAAFDVGCAVGRTSFDLSRSFKSVTGLDFSHAFIDAANSMKTTGTASYECVREGEIKETCSAVVPAGVHPDRITFLQGDACALPDAATLKGPFTVIHGANLLCRLPEPDKFLARLPGLLVAGGLVVFISPYSWLPQYTPRDKWVGGYVDDKGTAHPSAEGLKGKMEALGFTLIHTEECPFLIREHVRKYQWGCSHVTVWQLTTKTA